VPLLLVRHARAGEREEWDGPDFERPLDERGRAQAAHLVELLEPYPLEAVLTSPYVRCVDTVVPLADARGLALESRHELSEEWHATQGVALVRELAGRDVVVCGHGGLEDAVPGAPRWKKGTVFVLGPSLELLDAFRA
jgi:phosphohistidine phosphatase SixA